MVHCRGETKAMLKEFIMVRVGSIRPQAHAFEPVFCWQQGFGFGQLWNLCTCDLANKIGFMGDACDGDIGFWFWLVLFPF